MLISSQNEYFSDELEISKKRSNELNQFKYALDCSSIVSITDVNGTICDVNDRFCQITKYSRDELLGQNHKILKSNFHTNEFHKGIRDTITSGNVWLGDINHKAKDGSFYWTDQQLLLYLD